MLDFGNLRRASSNVLSFMDSSSSFDQANILSLYSYSQRKLSNRVK